MTALTHVELVWVKDRIENRIRFGPIAEQHVLDRSRQLVSLSGAGDRSGGHLVAAVVELATKVISKIIVSMSTVKGLQKNSQR